ncbi:MAG: hypothetical protein J6X69_03440 [Bacteroidales bacterium]|nr:hypothetical protein [Bacteroidales bacterium]
MLALLLWTAPLCLCGCRKATPATGLDFEAATKRSCVLRLRAPSSLTEGYKGGESEHDTLDIFAYDPENHCRIDSYSRIAYADEIRLTLTTGRKKLVVLCGVNTSRLRYADIVSMDHLQQVCGRLEEENPEKPLLSGTTEVDAGVNPRATVTLEPLLTRIRVSRLAADFSGCSYEGAVVDSVRIYLTNVSCRGSVLARDSIRAQDFVNYGRWSDGDIWSFASPGMLHDALEGNLTATPRSLATSLFCYPNQNPDEAAGSPFTRLVIECRINGERFYYPINIGRGSWKAAGMAEGVARGKIYDFDITLRHLGSRDPDTVVEWVSAGIFIKIEEWEEFNEKYEKF